MGISPDEAMRQASMTSIEYAIEAVKSYEKLTGLKIADDPKAAAIFVAGFMQAASVDYAAWAIQEQLERIGDKLGWLGNITQGNE